MIKLPSLKPSQSQLDREAAKKVEEAAARFDKTYAAAVAARKEREKRIDQLFAEGL